MILSIPNEIYSIESLEGLKYRYSTIILSEEYLNDDKILKQVVLASNTIVLICDTPKTPRELSDKYGVLIHDTLLKKSTTAEEIFRCVLSIIFNHRPRKMRKDDYLDVFKAIQDFGGLLFPSEKIDRIKSSCYYLFYFFNFYNTFSPPSFLHNFTIDTMIYR